MVIPAFRYQLPGTLLYCAGWSLAVSYRYSSTMLYILYLLLLYLLKVKCTRYLVRTKAAVLASACAGSLRVPGTSSSLSYCCCTCSLGYYMAPGIRGIYDTWYEYCTTADVFSFYNVHVLISSRRVHSYFSPKELLIPTEWHREGRINMANNPDISLSHSQNSYGLVPATARSLCLRAITLWFFESWKTKFGRVVRHDHSKIRTTGPVWKY